MSVRPSRNSWQAGGRRQNGRPMAEVPVAVAAAAAAGANAETEHTQAEAGGGETDG